MVSSCGDAVQEGLCVEQPARRARVAALSPPVCAAVTPLRARWCPCAPAGVGRYRKFKPSSREKRLSLVARAPPRLENTSGAAQKISESAARVLLLRNAFGVRTDAEKDDDHN